MNLDNAVLLIQHTWIKKRYRIEESDFTLEYYILCQSLVRMKQQKSKYNDLKSIVKIQRLFRFKRQAIEEFKYLLIITIQAYFRGKYISNRYNNLKESTIRLQSIWRGVSSRKNFLITKIQYSKHTTTNKISQFRIIPLFT